ncbi:MAG TPA: TRAM domain-containing protein, partial [Nitrospirae bacterium]|nr:TRAM domain-containing protein [Nitrospirota bacterium]
DVYKRQEDHQQTIAALEEIGYDGIFAFRYSERPGTKAALMEGGLPEKVRLARLKEILDLQEDITLKKNLSLVGTVLEVLVEGESASDSAMLSGRTRTNKIVNFYPDGPSGPTVEIGPGTIINLLIKQAHKHSLTGQYSGEPCG